MCLNFGIEIMENKKTCNVELGLKEVHYCECIGRDVGCRCKEVVMMLWNGVGSRLGVDLCDLLRLVA